MGKKRSRITLPQMEEICVAATKKWSYVNRAEIIQHFSFQMADYLFPRTIIKPHRYVQFSLLYHKSLDRPGPGHHNLEYWMALSDRPNDRGNIPVMWEGGQISENQCWYLAHVYQPCSPREIDMFLTRDVFDKILKWEASNG